MAPIQIISALPKFVSPEEHTNLVASTPASFSDIPPVLRHQQDGVSVTLDPPLDSLSEQLLAKGTLYVIESALVFLAPSGHGFQIEYPAITLHAISRSDTGPLIYCQLDEAIESRDPESEESTEIRELRINPEDPSALEPIFEALSFCAALHPDPNAPLLDEDLDDAVIDGGLDGQGDADGGEDDELDEVGRAARAHLESIITFAPGVEPPPDDEENKDAVEYAEKAGEKTPKPNGSL